MNFQRKADIRVSTNIPRQYKYVVLHLYQNTRVFVAIESSYKTGPNNQFCDKFLKVIIDQKFTWSVTFGIFGNIHKGMQKYISFANFQELGPNHILYGFSPYYVFGFTNKRKFTSECLENICSCALNYAPREASKPSPWIYLCSYRCLTRYTCF